MMRTIFFIVCAIFGSNNLRADSTEIKKIHFSAEQKQRIVSLLQNQIRIHEKMSALEIINDVEKTLLQARVNYQQDNPEKFTEIQQKFDEMINQTTLRFRKVYENDRSTNKEIAKQTILALELAELQEVLSARNYVFIFARWYADQIEPGQGPLAYLLDATFLIFCGGLDIVALPFEIAISFITGF